MLHQGDRFELHFEGKVHQEEVEETFGAEDAARGAMHTSEMAWIHRGGTIVGDKAGEL